MRPYFKSALSEAEASFLREHRILEEEVFIHPHIAVNRWPGIMKALKMVVAWGPACKTGGHRLRNRSNHCVVCRPETLSFQKRFSESATIYVEPVPQAIQQGGIRVCG